MIIDCANGQMMPFRRRNFESAAMVRELLTRVGRSRMWGQSLPPSNSLRAAQVTARRDVLMICERGTGDDADTELQQRSPAARFVDAVEAATHVVGVLTKGAGSPGSASLAQIEAAVAARKRLFFVFQPRDALSSPEGWSFEDNDADASVKAMLISNEAMNYRAKDASAHEHTAMVLELLRRMQPAAGGGLDETHEAGTPWSMWASSVPAATAAPAGPSSGGRSFARHQIVPVTCPQEWQQVPAGPVSRA